MSRQRTITQAFWTGVAFHAGFMMMYQDTLGLERYIERVREGWVDLHWAVGMFIAGLALWYYHKLKGTF